MANVEKYDDLIIGSGIAGKFIAWTGGAGRDGPLPSYTGRGVQRIALESIKPARLGRSARQHELQSKITFSLTQRPLEGSHDQARFLKR